MKTLGNIILIPIKVICFTGFIISIIGIILSTIIEHISNTILGIVISLSIILVLAYFIFYGTNITESPGTYIVIFVFILTILISLIPLLFQGIYNLFKKGLTFWF
jgi:RsiW-degrading membrane proteinase PrsW (M82 family)